jgi:uncharacterized membrane protein YccC
MTDDLTSMMLGSFIGSLLGTALALGIAVWWTNRDD